MEREGHFIGGDLGRLRVFPSCVDLSKSSPGEDEEEDSKWVSWLHPFELTYKAFVSGKLVI